MSWPDLPHGHDGGQVSFLAATDQRHGSAATGRFRHTEFNLPHGNQVEAGWLVFVTHV